MSATRFTELVGCVMPIQQAGMDPAAPPELAAAVSQAGALGMRHRAARAPAMSALAPPLGDART